MNEKILDMVELFNVPELKEHPFGYALERFPQSVYNNVGEFGAMVTTYSCNCELRFVKENPESIVRITLMAENSPGDVTVMRGDRWSEVYYFNKSQIITIDIGKSMLNNVKNQDFFIDDTYSKDVVRLIFHAARFILCNIETFGRKIRPPKKDELPKKTILAYGSSVTHGAGGLTSPLDYASHTARMLKAQTLNKAMGGSCFNEKCVADWFTELEYDYMIYEPGTNMFDNFESDIIEERCSYMVSKLLKAHPDRYIFMMEPPMPYQKCDQPNEYKKLLQAVHNVQKNAGSEKCVLFEMNKIQPSSTYVCSDLIHPSTFGHIMMGTNLAALISGYLKKGGK